MLRFIFLFAIWTSTGAVTLEDALLQDMMPPSSSSCNPSASGTTSFNFDFTSTNNVSSWDPTYALRYESDVFLAEMSHVDPDEKKSWTLRVGPGGNPYSYVGAFGEAMPPQRHSDSPWNDEVFQQVAVANSLNGVDGHPYFIHQAGTYTREDELRSEPFYSPTVAQKCSSEDRTCTFAAMGQQAHVPTIYKSNDLYYTRYKDCGDGVQELTWLMHNSGESGSEQWDYFNVPWGGVRTTTFKDMLIGRNVGSPAEIIEPLWHWGDDNELPKINTLSGYTMWAQDLPSTLEPEYDLPYVPRRINSCSESTFHSDRDGKFTMRCTMEAFEGLGWGGYGGELTFWNPNQPGKLEVSSILHWNGNGNLYAYPVRIVLANGDSIDPDVDKNDFLSAVHALFPTGDEWFANYTDSGFAPEDNLAMSIVYGMDGQFGTRVRIGGTYRDYTVWTLNPVSLRLNPGESFYYRQYVIVGEYQNLDSVSASWTGESLQGKLSSDSDYAAIGRDVYLMSVGDDGATQYFGALVADVNEPCGSAVSRCTGSTVPGAGRRPLYNVKCGNASYIGSDQYHFADLSDGFYRPYRCNGNTLDPRATWTLLGYFIEGACDYLQNAEYQTTFCAEQDTAEPTVIPTETPTALPTTAAPTEVPSEVPTATPTTAIPTAQPTTQPTYTPNSLPGCGNGACDSGETCETCPVDCAQGNMFNGRTYCCGDGSCAVGFEDDGSCAVDCIEIPTYCDTSL